MNEVKTISVQMDVPKESKEVVDLVDKIIEKAMAKAQFEEYQTLLGDLMVAVEGVLNIENEVKSEYRDELAGYISKVLMARLAPVKADDIENLLA